MELTPRGGRRSGVSPADRQSSASRLARQDIKSTIASVGTGPWYEAIIMQEKQPVKGERWVIDTSTSGLLGHGRKERKHLGESECFPGRR